MEENNCFELEINHPDQTQILSVEWLEIESPTGNFVVGPNYIPTISIMKDGGKLKYKDSNKSHIEIVDVYGGIFAFLNNKAYIMLDV